MLLYKHATDICGLWVDVNSKMLEALPFMWWNTSPMSDRKPIEPPADTPDYMVDAWVSCLHWALGEEEIIAAFRRETGVRWTPGKTGIERMIDQATGADYRFLAEFVAWFNVAIWGPIDG